jgi:hypothetical protein
MALLEKLTALEQRHKQLDENIKRGYTSYLDDAHLGKMKQEKLFVKRQIEQIKTELGV